MLRRWMLSKFFRDANDNLVSVAGSYGIGTPDVPRNPATDAGWALVSVRCAPQQLEAARQDDNVIVCPLAFDPVAAPAEVLAAYASWGVTAGMPMGSVLAKLAETEPIFGQF